MLPTKLDHCVIHVTDWERSNAFYTNVLGADARRAAGRLCLSFRRQAAQRPWAGREAGRSGALPVAPGNSDLCFEWIGPIADAVEHLDRCGIRHRERSDAALRRQGRGHQRLFPRSRRLADGIHVLRASRRRTVAMAEAPGTARSDRPAGRHSGAAGRRRRAASDRHDAARSARLPATSGRRSISSMLEGPHRPLHLSAHRRARRRSCRRAGTTFPARAAARRNPAVFATISPISKRSASRISSACRPRTPTISAKPPSGCICRSRSCPMPILKFAQALKLPTFTTSGMTLLKRMVLVIDDGDDRQSVLSGVSARQKRGGGR